MTHSLFVAGIALVVAAQTTLGQTGAAVRSSPPGRAHHAVFYDEARQRVLVTGGSAVDNRRNVTEFDDLWSFDGSGWVALASPGDPKSGLRVEADARHRIYSLGGFTDSSGGALRVLENDRWRRVTANPSNVMRGEPGFVFDAARNRFVGFGSSASSGRATAEVWEFDGSRWTRSTANPPPGRFSHVMVYDPRRKRTVVFGGMGARSGEQSAPLFGDTWEFDGTTWSEIPGAGPPPRLGAGVAYDSKRGLVLVFGGANHERVFNDLWSWDGATWRKLAESGPEPRVMGYIAYDKKRDRVVLFGGRPAPPENRDLGDTWEWDGATWRRFAPGAGGSGPP